MPDSAPVFVRKGAPVEAIQAALTAAFPVMLRTFLESEEARDVTGKWGFTTKTGDEFRADLYALWDPPQEGESDGR
jgi:hypothetical protein